MKRYTYAYTKYSHGNIMIETENNPPDISAVEDRIMNGEGKIIDEDGGYGEIELLEVEEYNDLSYTDEDRLERIKSDFSDDYDFKQSMTIQELKEIITSGSTGNLKTIVPFLLEVGNLGIDVFISEKNDTLSLEYNCHRKVDGEWGNYSKIDEVVNLDVPDIETEMLAVLDKFATERGLFYYLNNEFDDEYYDETIIEDEADNDLEM